MTGHVRVGGVWKDLAGVSVRVGGVWKTVDKGFTRVGGVWKEWYSASQPAMELIQTYSLSSNATSVTFSSIPQTYQHLKVVVVGKDPQASNTRSVFKVIVNNATNGHSTVNNGRVFGSITWSRLAEFAYIGADGILQSQTNPTQAFTTVEMDFHNYRASRPKTGSWFMGNHSNVQFIYQGALSQTTTSAITSLRLETNNQGFQSGSRLSLYGIKGA